MLARSNRPCRSATRRYARPGFTLIELLLVMVILGILAMLAVTSYPGSRERAFIASLQSDLRHLTVIQELYHSEHGSYADLPELLQFTPSPGVELEFTFADARGWAAVAKHGALGDFQCGVFSGIEELATYAAPAEEEGVIACDQI